MANEEELRILKTMPWRTPISDWSYAGVAVFEKDSQFIIAPLKTEETNLYYCFVRALKLGNKLVGDGVWKSFTFTFNSNPKAKWIHVILKGKTK